MVGLGLNNLPGSCVTYSGLVEWLRNTTIAHNVQICERMLDFFNTGYSLSDQHIFSPINPKYDDWFCQIYIHYRIVKMKKVRCNLGKTICPHLVKNNAKFLRLYNIKKAYSNYNTQRLIHINLVLVHTKDRKTNEFCHSQYLNSLGRIQIK